MMDDTGSIVTDTEIPDPTMGAPVSVSSDPAANLTPLPLTPEQMTEWWGRVEESREQRKIVSAKWDILMEEYLPVVTKGAEDVRAGIHFRNVHTKKEKIFFKEPDLVLTAAGPLKDVHPDPLTGIIFAAQDSVAIYQAVLNKRLGRKGANVKRTIGQVLFDILAWAGIGCTKIGYLATIKNIEEPVMIPDPSWVPPPPAPGSMLGLSQPAPPMIQATDPATGQPQTKTTPVPIFEDWYWKRFSPKKLLLPKGLTSSMFDAESDWLAMEFALPEAVVRAMFRIPPEVELPLSAEGDENIYKHENQTGVRAKSLVTGVELWYKASIFDAANQPHPQAMRQLVLIDGMKEAPVVHRPSPDQTFDPLGKLTPDSMIGFPIHIFTNRDLADTPWIPADTAFTNSSAKHINTHRRQSVQLRDANIPKFAYDSGAFTPDEIKRIKDGKVGEWIEVMDGRLANGIDKIMAAIVKSEASRDDWRIVQMMKQDIEETLGIGGTNAGATEDTVRTATEISTSASALAERMQGERDFILATYLEGVEKFGTLIQRYADDEDYVEWTGMDGTKQMTPWNKHTIAGRWAYDAKPDSQLQIDVARDRAQILALIKELAPFHGTIVNIKPVVRAAIGKFGSINPAEVILPDPPMMPPGGMPQEPGMPPSASGPPVPGAAPTGALPNAPSPGAGTTQMVQAREQGVR